MKMKHNNQKSHGQQKDLDPKTTIWDGGNKLVKTIPGLPYGTQETVFIAGLGEVFRSGIEYSCSGDNKSITEVKYTLK